LTPNSSDGIIAFGDPEDGNVGRITYNHPSNYMNFLTSDIERMRIDSSGNVGIGTSSPLGKLKVAVGDNAPAASGNMNTGVVIESAFGSRALNIGVNNTAGYSWINAAFANNSSVADNLVLMTGTTERVRIDTSGNVLVATTNAAENAGPGIKLAYSTTDPTVRVVANSATGGNSGYILYNTNATNNGYRFYVTYAGVVNAVTTTIAGISDQRLKENIRDIDEGLDAVMALKPRKFDWKEGKGANTKNARGFIAQEFEQVFPDLVDEWKEPAPEGEEPYKSVRADLIPTLVKAIQEQQDIIKALETRIQALENQ